MNWTSTKRVGISGVVVTIVAILAVVGGTAFYYAPTLNAAFFPPKGGGSACGAPTAGTLTERVGMLLGAGGPFNPKYITVVIGINSTITWTNDDPKSEHHTVTLRDNTAVLNSGDMGPGASFTCSFTTPGIYDYYCVYHPLQFGTIIVKAR